MKSHMIDTLIRHVCVGTLVVALVGTGVWRVSAQSGPMTLPAGTTISIRTIDVVNSKGAAPDTEYRATVDDSVIIDGTTVVPTGTEAFLRLLQVQQAGAVRGRASLSLRLVALSVNGTRIPLETGEAAIKSGSQAARTTKSALLGAGVGALIGGLFGGGKGAAQGAAGGAAAGTVAAVVAGQKVRVPAETRLSFTLSQPAQIQQQ